MFSCTPQRSTDRAITVATPSSSCYNTDIMLKHLSAFVFSILLLFILLITSFEAVCYWTPDYFKTEYTKYDVLSDVNGEMTMDSVLEVTDEMMSYLRGDRQNLIVETIIDDQPQEFFNDREKAHMADVRDLFVGAITLRALAILTCIAIAGGLVLLTKHPLRILARGYLRACAIVLGLALLLALLAATDFTKYFTIFHEIFFSNDLWLLDPRTDNLINLLPEAFFMDTALRILLTFAASVLVLLIPAFLADRRKPRP